MQPGVFTHMVSELREERLRRGMQALDWAVIQNRIRSTASHNQARFDEALTNMAPGLGFRLLTGLSERVAYRELFLLGLTHFDLRHIPQFANVRSKARAEIDTFVRELALPTKSEAVQMPLLAPLTPGEATDNPLEGEPQLLRA